MRKRGRGVDKIGVREHDCKLAGSQAGKLVSKQAKQSKRICPLIRKSGTTKPQTGVAYHNNHNHNHNHHCCPEHVYRCVGICTFWCGGVLWSACVCRRTHSPARVCVRVRQCARVFAGVCMHWRATCTRNVVHRTLHLHGVARGTWSLSRQAGRRARKRAAAATVATAAASGFRSGFRDNTFSGFVEWAAF